MSHGNRNSKRKGRTKAVTILGVAGALSLAGGASGAAVGPPSDTLTANTAVTLYEEEISDVSLSTFYVFDHENAGLPGLRLAQRTRSRGCGGCSGCGGPTSCASCASAGGGRSLLIILSVSICRAAAEPADARRRAADRGEYRQAAGDSCGSTPANARLRATQGHLQPSCRVPCKQPSQRRL